MILFEKRDYFCEIKSFHIKFANHLKNLKSLKLPKHLKSLINLPFG